MTNAIRSRQWVPALVFAFLALGFSNQALSAPVTFWFDNTTTPVYDLSGSYQFDQVFTPAQGAPIDLSLGFAIQEDAVGRLVGAGMTPVTVGTNSYAANYRIRGRVSGGGAVTRVFLVGRFEATNTTPAGAPLFVISVRYKLMVTPGGLSGTARGSGRIADAGRGRIHSSISGVLLPPGAGGSWSVTLNLNDSTRIRGAGSILLSNGRTLNGKVAGSAVSVSGPDQVRFSGASADRGTVLKMNFFPRSGGLRRMNGRVLGQTVAQTTAASDYAGEQACTECHSPIQQTVANTRHAQVGVQCENCHGPAAAHAANYYDPTTRPMVDLTGTVCGNCHSGPKHPVYEEWSASLHSQVVEDMNPTNRISSCGRCHSGSVRLSLLEGKPLPEGNANVPIGCPTCHNPHDLTGNSFQLRNPLFSTNDYSLSTSDDFAAKYDPNVNLCAQCHNDRGASWTSTSRPPHHSPQYNILLGTVGELDSGLPHFDPATHALLITNQCAGCHMQTAPYESPSQPAITGHHFTVELYGTCLACHPQPQQLVQFVSNSISNQIQQVKFELDLWAATKAPPALYAKYGTRAWEYTNPGELSPGGLGPDATEQKEIPVTIQKARFNLYLVLHDGSFGTHNGPYCILLLDTAENWVETELDQ